MMSKLLRRARAGLVWVLRRRGRDGTTVLTMVKESATGLLLRIIDTLLLRRGPIRSGELDKRPQEDLHGEKDGK